MEARSENANNPEEGDIIIQEFIERQHKMMESINKVGFFLSWVNVVTECTSQIADAITMWASTRKHNRGDEVRKIREQRYNQ